MTFVTHGQCDLHIPNINDLTVAALALPIIHCMISPFVMVEKSVEKSVWSPFVMLEKSV